MQRHKVSSRERKESELRYVRLLMSKEANNGVVVKRSHPRFEELKVLHGIEDEKPSAALSYQKNMAYGLLSVTLKCVGASLGEKPSQLKKLPGSTTGSPFPIPLDDDQASLVDMGIGNGSIILVDEDTSTVKFLMMRKASFLPGYGASYCELEWPCPCEKCYCLAVRRA